MASRRPMERAITRRLIYGFTGTRAGMTWAQKQEVRRLLTSASSAHHGDCVGADADFHEMCLELGVPVFIHPPSDNRQRAFCKGAFMVLKPLPYLARNRIIVDRCEQLIAIPKEQEEPNPGRAGGGTWMTVRYARKVGRPGHLIWPSGNHQSLMTEE